MNGNEFAQSMQSLGTRYLEEYTRALQRYADYVGSVAEPGRSSAGLADTADMSALQKRYSDFVVSQAPAVLVKLSEANMSYYSTLANLSLNTFNAYVDSVLRTMDSPSRTDTGASGNETALLFHGMRGKSASNAFLITNHRDEAIDVEFDIAEVRDQEDGEQFKPKAKFTPEKCHLPAHSERVIQCSLPLSGKFVAGRSYDGSIAVVGYPEMAIRISVQVEDDKLPESRSEGAGKPVAPKKEASGKKTRSRKTGSKKKRSKLASTKRSPGKRATDAG